MIRFFEKPIWSKNSYVQIDDDEDVSKASHFRHDDGPIQPIAELNPNIHIENINTDDVEPLELPTLNFGNEDTTFNNEEVNNDEEMIDDDVTPLPLPRLF